MWVVLMWVMRAIAVMVFTVETWVAIAYLQTNSIGMAIFSLSVAMAAWWVSWRIGRLIRDVRRHGRGV